MAQPYRHKQSGIYYLRRKVPEALRPALGREFKRSLDTREADEAKARFAAAWAESERAFALARTQASGAEVLSAQDAQQLASRWFRAEQERLERTGRFTDVLVEGPRWTWGLGDSQHEHQTYVSVQQAADEGDEEGWDEAVIAAMRGTMFRHKLPMPAPKTEAFARLSAAFEEQMVSLSEWALKRHDGERAAQGGGALPHGPLNIEKPPTSTKGGRSVRKLFCSYAQEKKLNDGDTRATQSTLAEYERIVERFVELYGDLDASEVTREAISAYRVALSRLPAKGEGTRGLTAWQLIAKADSEDLPRLSEPTIRNKLRALSAMLSHGVRLGWLQENPVIAGGAGRAAAKAASKKRTASTRRKHYTSEELSVIFTSPIYSQAGWTPSKAQFGKAWYWLPLLLYYTGARREELAQLKPSEVSCQDGVWCLSILATGDDGKRGVKTMGSRRFVPLHPDLIERGFLQYVGSMPADGQLFPLLKPDPQGYFGTNFGRRWASYLRETVKLDSPASPIHGFRHTFKTLAREVGMPEDVHDAITGHAGQGGAAREYGSMPLSRMASELAKLPKLA
jgi:integrase